MISVGLLYLLAFVGPGALAFPTGTGGLPTRRQKVDVCTNQACQDIAAQLKRYTTTNAATADPCKNMDTFVCSGYRADHPVGLDTDMENTFQDQIDAAEMIVTRYAEADAPPIDTPGDKELFALMKTLYETCKAVDPKVMVDFGPMREILKNIENRFPVSSTAFFDPNTTKVTLDDAEDFAAVLKYMGEVGVSTTLWEIAPTHDDRHNDVRAVYIGPGVLPFGGWAYQEPVLDEYYTAVAQTIFNAHPNIVAQRNAEELAQAMITFESKLYAVVPTVDQIVGPNRPYDMLTLDEAAELLPILGLHKLIPSLIPPGADPNKIKIVYPDVVREIAAIVMETSKETLQVYFMWRALYNFAHDIYSRENNAIRRFYNFINGNPATATPNMQIYCLGTVSDLSFLGWIFGRWYAEEYYPDESADMAEEIAANLKAAYVNIVNESGWMEAQVAAVALEKMEKMDFQIGAPFDNNPVDVRDPQSVLDYYAGLNLTTANNLGNWLSVIKVSMGRWWGALDDAKPPSANWQMTPQMANAYHIPDFNTIAFPVAIMTLPRFNPQWPAYMNYAGLGTIVGHEMAHSLDRRGRWYDPDGNLDNWWTEKSSALFEDRAQCFVGQFDKYGYTLPSGEVIHLNGQYEVNENIADSAGLKAAFAAYQRHKEQHGDDPKLPGMEQWTTDQLFFIAYANAWCGGYTLDAIVDMIESDLHAILPFRIVGSLANNKGFKEAFECEDKEPKCEMW